MSQRILIDGVAIGGVVSTDIVERPAIVDDNSKVILATPEMEMLPVEQLKLLAKLSKGRLVWRNYEVTYREVISKKTNSHAFCDYKECLALAEKGSDYCGDKHRQAGTNGNML